VVLALSAEGRGEKKRTLFNTVLLGALVVWVLRGRGDALDTLVEMVLVACALGGAGAFYETEEKLGQLL
jgi:hypothetical protein